MMLKVLTETQKLYGYCLKDASLFGHSICVTAPFLPLTSVVNEKLVHCGRRHRGLALF